MRYSYDEVGIYFYYFLISILGLILVPVTCSFLKKHGKASKQQYCRCSECQSKVERLNSSRRQTPTNYKLLLCVCGWMLFGFLGYKITVTEVELPKIWDPYEVLGISMDATLPEIKKHYKKMSLIYHPDKVKEEVKDTAETKFVEITKAYKVLTDDDTRRNYEEYGHPDGKQSVDMGIALPSWLVKSHNSFWVLGVYGLVFGLLLPFFAGRWWYRSLRFTKDKILNETMGSYFKELKENTTFRGIVEILSASLEFKAEFLTSDNKLESEKIARLAEHIRTVIEAKKMEKLEKSRKFTEVYCYKTQVLLYACFHRVPVEDPQLKSDQTYILETALHLLNGMLQISCSHQWLQSSLYIIELGQMIVQALWYQESPLLQLPHLHPELLKHFQTKKRKIRSIYHFVELEEDERRSLLRSMDDEKYAELIEVARAFPHLELLKGYATVVGDENITVGAIVTIVLEVEVMPTAEAVARAASNSSSSVAEERSKTMEPVHSPYFPRHKNPYWWVLLADPRTNKLVLPPTKLVDLVSTKRVEIKFQAPDRPGTYSFTVFIKSDTIVGADVREELCFNVHNVSVLPPEPVVDEDISDVEEDSLAGQMAKMRRR